MNARHGWDALTRAVEAGWPEGDGHSPVAHEAISAELVRLTLGGRGPARPELRVDDPFAALRRAVEARLEHVGRVWANLARALRPALDATTDDAPGTP